MKKLILAAMAVALMTVASKAEAALAFSFTICQAATCQTFPGQVVVGAVIGDYTINQAVGNGTNATPISTSTNLDLTITRTGQTSVAPLDVWFTVTGYTLPNGAQYDFDVSFGTTQQTIDPNNPARSLVTYQAWYSSTNAAGPPFPPAGSSPSALAGCTPAVGPLTDSCNSNPSSVIVGPGSNLFSITTLTQFFIQLNSPSQYGSLGQTSLAAIPSVPEPGSMVLLGSGLLGMAAMIRRRYARK